MPLEEDVRKEVPRERVECGEDDAGGVARRRLRALTVAADVTAETKLGAHI